MRKKTSQFYFKKMFLFSVSILVFCSSMQAAKLTAQEVQRKYKNSFELFISMQENYQLLESDLMGHLFLQLDGSSDVLMKSLRSDRKILKKAMKKAKKNKALSLEELEKDYQTICDLYIYLKMYRLNNDVFFFHRQMCEKWGKFSAFITNDKDIISLVSDLGIENQNADSLKNLLKIIKKDQQIADEYENMVHSDWIDLKLANYVLRVELIRIRNAAMFHPLLDGVKIKTIYPR
ncbi:MAG: hypothetical protein NTU89_04440 [Candidatus Dependentiae bacterium]|nr:hypothetical protein [Candidatus Dependentiae bacterium]